jgi:transposase
MVSAQSSSCAPCKLPIAGIEHLIADRVAAHPRARLLRALPGVGTINLAQLLAEVGPILDWTASAEQAATECGTAPVTRASGKTTSVYFRWAASTRARKAITAFALNARMQSPWAAPALRRRPRPAPAGRATPTPPALSLPPGSASSGPAGTPASPTTPTPTASTIASPREDLT